jgi:glyoxylase-like metal-dependent hydrolase (beta-lactamase superfamily II)
MTNTVAVAVRDDGDIVLVDAGWSAEACQDARKAIGRVKAGVLGVQLRPEDAIVAQLRVLGFDPGRVRAIVATHLHSAHVGGVEDFPNAEVVVSQAELRAYWGAPAASRGPASPYRASNLARAGRIRAVQLDGTPTYGFPGSCDVFRTGEVVMLDAPGHTAGGVAVALRGPRGTFVHAGDAVLQRWEFGGTPPGPSIYARRSLHTRKARRELARTYESLRCCEVDPRRPTIVPSHDAEVFEALPQMPGTPRAGGAL